MLRLAPNRNSMTFLRVRASLFLLLVLTLGCGDCIQVSDFVDIIEPFPDMSIDLDMGEDVTRPDMSQPEDDFGDPKDLFVFDFGDEDFNLPDPAFELQGVIPATGPVDGGTMVRIEGTGLRDGSIVLFASQAVTATLSGGALVARTPPGSGPGPVSVKVLAPDGRSRVMVDAFRYVSTLRIGEVSPTRVPIYGGIDVEIRGNGFNSSTAVSFGAHQALRVDVLSDSYIRALAPPQAIGVVDVRLTTPEATAVAPRAITYYQPLEFLDVVPASGVAVGGDLVTIRGKGIDSSLQVLFDGLIGTVENVNLAQQALQVRTPPGIGLADITLITDNDAVVAEDAFYFRPDDSTVLAILTPRVGPLSGGNEVLALGFGFSASQEFLIGGTPATVVNRTSSSARLQVPPGAAPGAVDVILSEANVPITTLPGHYTYAPDLIVNSVSPDNGPTEGGTVLIIVGSGFLTAERVEIGGVSAIFEVVSDTEIRVTTPGGRAGQAEITVKTTLLSSTLEGAFTYLEDLEIWGFSPTRGSIAGGTLVSVRGQGFSGQMGVLLEQRIGTQIRRIDRNNLTFRTPPSAPGSAELVVESGEAQAIGPYDYIYFNPASQFGGPSGGPVDGSVNVTVYSSGGGPLEKAFVMLSTRADTPYQGFTDVNGMVTLSGLDVLGAQTVTATAAGYSTSTIQTVDAENVTLFLNLLDPPPNPGGGAAPPFATLNGKVTATGKLSDPDDELVYDMAVVATTQRALFSGNPAPGINSIVLGEGNYEIRTRIGDMAVIVLCGSFNTATQEFLPQLAGIERYVFLSDQEVRKIDLNCNIPLDQALNFKLVNTDFAPTGPDNNVMEVFWDFGFEGVFRSPTRGRTLSTLVTVPRQPSLTGILADISFVAMGGSYTGLGLPFSRVFAEGITQTNQIITMAPLLDVPDPVSPLPGGTVTDNLIRFKLSSIYPPDFTYIVLRNSLGIPVWDWVIPAGQESAVIPTFPSFAGLPPAERPNPLVQEPLYMTIFTARMKGGFVYERFTYRDIALEVWRAYSLNNWTIRLPAP